jgi:hypothetical protein
MEHELKPVGANSLDSGAVDAPGIVREDGYYWVSKDGETWYPALYDHGYWFHATWKPTDEVPPKIGEEIE